MKRPAKTAVRRKTLHSEVIMPKEKENVDVLEVCPDCGSKHLVRDYARGELSCEKCGLVLNDQLIDQGPDWRSFESDAGKEKSHAGSPETLMMHDKGLSTEISKKDRDCNGNRIPAHNRVLMYRLRKWQKRNRISNGTERNLAIALTQLDRIASAMSLPDNIKEAAALIYRKAVKKNLIRGRSIEGVVAASIYAACRQCGVPRTLDEVAENTSSDRREIGRTYRFMTRELNLKLMPTNPQDYLQRFCSELNLDGPVQNKSAEILRDATERELTSGKGPTGVAAAAIYISSILCNERRTQREVADVAGVTEVTIRNRYKELTDELGIKVAV